MSDAVLTQRRPLPLRLLIAAFLVVWVILAAFPFVWTVWGSFKVEPDFFSRESWWNAIVGTYTQIQTGAAFTGYLSIIDVDIKAVWQSDQVMQLYPSHEGRNSASWNALHAQN